MKYSFVINTNYIILISESLLGHLDRLEETTLSMYYIVSIDIM